MSVSARAEIEIAAPIEVVWGVITWALPLTAVQDGFDRHARALRERAESLAAKAR